MPKSGSSSKVSDAGNKKRSSGGVKSAADFILKTMADRDPKKRKVKPNSNLLYLDLLADSSSDDEEYLPKSKDIAAAEKDDDMEEDDDENDDEDDDEDEDDEDEEDEEDEKEHKDKSSKTSVSLNDFVHSKDDFMKGSNDLSSVRFELPTKVTKLLVCSVCMGDVSHEADEIVECDSCGITVHEACYGVTNDSDGDADSVNSNASSASTEPWFCDACLANVTSPVCDLCPNTGGIFKQTDVKRWVHLVCALYIPGVAFNDTSHLSGVTLFELSYDRWGARTCILCEDERLSRTGVCVSCDAGMCKAYFHVTCAQSHGLLVEAQTTEETELVDPFYAHCKVHAGDKAAVKAKRRNWLALQSKMKIKRQQQQEKSLNERIVRKLQKARLKWAKLDESKQASWIPNQKIPRLLTTSSSAVKKLIKKAELLGMSPQTQYIAAQDVDIRKKWHLPPAFSIEFVSYYLDRNNRMNSMQKRVDELKNQCRQFKGSENTIRQRYEELANQVNQYKTENAELKQSGRNIWTLLANISKEDVPMPKLFDNEVVEKRDEESGTGDQIGESVNSSPLNLLVECGICHRSHDFQKLALCDSCKLHYHLYCLDPPLKRMPKKTRFGGWQCSDCTEKEEEEEEESKSDNDQNADEFVDTPNKRRRLREHVKGPNKFVPDADTTNNTNEPVKKKKRGRKKKKVKGIKKVKNKIKRESVNDEDESATNSVNRKDSMSPNNSILINLESVKRVIKPEEECAKCKVTSKSSLLVQCDQCLMFYHFGCCNPPLRKNPKKKGYQWFCEECDDSDDESYEDEDEDEDENDDDGSEKEEKEKGDDEGEEDDDEESDDDDEEDEEDDDDDLERIDGKYDNEGKSERKEYLNGPIKQKDSKHYNSQRHNQYPEVINGHGNSAHLKENGKIIIRLKENGN